MSNPHSHCHVTLDLPRVQCRMVQSPFLEQTFNYQRKMRATLFWDGPLRIEALGSIFSPETSSICRQQFANMFTNC